MFETGPALQPADLEDRYRVLLELTPDAICVHQSGVFVYVNPAGLRYLGAESEQQVLGQSIQTFLHPDSLPAVLARIGSLTEAGAVSAPSEAIIVPITGTPLEMEAVSVRTMWNGEPAFQVILRDLTAQKQAAAALRYQAALVSHVSDAIIATDASGIVTSWNPAAESVYGKSSVAAVGQPVEQGIGAPLDLASIVASGGTTFGTHVRGDKSEVSVRISASTMADGYVLVCADETAVRRAEQHFITVVDSLQEGVVVLARDGSVDSANPAACRILGIEVGDKLAEGYIAEMPFAAYDTGGRLLGPADHPGTSVVNGDGSGSQILGIERRRDGRKFWLDVTATLLDPGLADSALVYSFNDVTEQYESAQRLEYAATHDHLTSLANRASIVSRLEHELTVQVPRSVLAVLFIDLDNFKSMNDTYGHGAGDDLLRKTAVRLQEVCRADDLIGRFGGDEFVALVRCATENDVQAVMERFHTSLRGRMDVGGRLVKVRASIGAVTVQSGQRRNAESVLHEADRAMYLRKAHRVPARGWSDKPAEIR